MSQDKSLTEWYNFPKDKLVEFLTDIFKKDSVVNDIMVQVINEEGLAKCIFISSRGSTSKCNNSAVVPYGYCAKHEKTVQAKTALKKFNLLSESLLHKDLNTSFKDEPQPREEPQEEEDKSSEKEEDIPPKEETEEDSPKKESLKRQTTVHMNKHGNWEDKETHIVFDNNKMAYGVQRSDGVYLLSPKDITTCILKGWRYTIPEAKINYEDSSEGEHSSSNEEQSSDDDYY